LALAGRARARREGTIASAVTSAIACYNHGMRNASTESLQFLAVRTALPALHSASSIVPPPDLHRGKSRTIPQ
jgi:hypothetical protein